MVREFAAIMLEIFRAAFRAAPTLAPMQHQHSRTLAVSGRAEILDFHRVLARRQGHLLTRNVGRTGSRRQDRDSNERQRRQQTPHEHLHGLTAFSWGWMARDDGTRTRDDA